MTHLTQALYVASGRNVSVFDVCNHFQCEFTLVSPKRTHTHDVKQDVRVVSHLVYMYMHCPIMCIGRSGNLRGAGDTA